MIRYISNMDSYTEPAYQSVNSYRSKKMQKEWMVTRKCKECNMIVLLREDEFLCSKCSLHSEESEHTITHGNYLETML